MQWLFLLCNCSLLLACSRALQCPAPLTGSRTQQRLKSALFCDYDNEERPVKNDNMAVNVNISLILKHITVSSASNKYDITSWLLVNWVDEYLKWNPEEYGQTERLLIPKKYLWVPDLSLTTSDMSQVQVMPDNMWCKLYSDGRVKCLPPLSTTFYCQQDLTNWPYDTQRCEFILGSYGYLGHEVVVNLSGKGYIVVEGVFEKNNEYELINMTATKLESSTCCPNQTFAYFKFTFSLRHHTGLYAASIVTPAFVLSVVTLSSFWVRGLTTRAVICCTSLLGNSLFLIYIGSVVPTSGDTSPLIVAFYRDALVLTVVALLVAMGVERAHDQSMWCCDAPGWLVDSTAWLRGHGGIARQMLLGDSEGVQQNEQQTEDGTKSEPPCSSIATMLDNLVFIAVMVAYFVMLIALLP